MVRGAGVHMYVLMFTVSIIIIYIKSFQDNFTKEKIDKVAPILMLIAIVTVIMLIISSFISR